jgi:hypothetical protein
MTKKYLGWSAEDDLDYKYPDTTFAPQGSIRIIVTEKLLKLIEYGFLKLKPESQEYKGFISFLNEVIVHELTHAYQYSTAPVQDLMRAPESCYEKDSTGKTGRCDDQLIQSTRKKITYEHEAMSAGREQLLGHETEIMALIAHLESSEKIHPNDFNETGKYFLLSSKNANPLVSHYLKNELKLAPLGTKFAPDAEIYYNAQYRIPEITNFLIDINEKGFIGEPDFHAEIVSMNEEMRVFLLKDVGLLEDEDLAYLIPVVERYKTEHSFYIQNLKY